MAQMKKRGSMFFQTEGGGTSSYNDEEMQIYVNVVNRILASDPDVGSRLPINPESEEIFDIVGDGILFCKLVNSISKNTIDERTINKKNLNVFKVHENLNLAIQSARGLGVNLISLQPERIIEKNKTQILSLMAQFIRAQILADLGPKIKNNPYLYRLKREDESWESFATLSTEELLVRWFNFHLGESSYPDRKIVNLGPDVKDAMNYTILLNQLAPKIADLSSLKLDVPSRSRAVIDNGTKMGVPPLIKPKDIMEGNIKANFIYCSYIYMSVPFGGLEPKEKVDTKMAEELQKAFSLEEKRALTREERTIVNWANSQGIEGFRIRDPDEDFCDGLFLLKLIDKLAPETVEWKKMESKPDMKIKKMINCNHALELGKKMGISIPGTGGADIVDGNRLLILGFVWQLMRKSILELIGNKTEQELLKWGNDYLNQETEKIASFGDKKLKSSKYFLLILKKIRPDEVDLSIIKEGDSNEAIENNATYCISCSRKFGAMVYLVWEDIRDLNKKLLMCFAAALARLAEESKNKQVVQLHKKLQGKICNFVVSSIVYYIISM